MERGEKNGKRFGWGRETATLVVTVVALAAALVFALRGINGFAWFANYKEVDATGMSVNADEGALFEIARVTSSPFPAVYPAEEPYTSFLPSEGYDKLLITTSEHPGIILMLNNEVENEDAEPGKEYCLRPGSYGTVEFFIVPNEDNLTVHFNLNSLAYSDGAFLSSSSSAAAEPGSGQVSEPTPTPAPLSASAIAANTVKGHLLFFEQRSGQGAVKKYSQYISPEEGFSFSTADHTPETVGGKTVYRVTIYWVWPKTFACMVLPDGHESLYGSSLFSGGAGEGSDIAAMRDYVAANPNRFFCDAADHEGDATNYAALAADPEGYIVKLCDGYNNADQNLGEMVDFVIVEIAASGGHAAPTPTPTAPPEP